MRFLSKVWIALLAAALLPCASFAASFTTSLDRDTIALGEQATLSLKFEDVQPKDAPGIPQIDGLQFQYVGPSSAFSFVNGQTTSSVTYSYVVTAQHDGEFTIPGLRANISGQELDSAPLKLTVTKTSAPTADAINSGNEIAFMKLSMPKQKFYAGESFLAELQLYLRDDVQNFGNFQMTGSQTDGFSAGNTVELQNQRRRVQVGNHLYTEIPLAIPLTAQKTGSLAIGPFTANCVVVLPARNQNGEWPFFNQGEQHQVTLATEAMNVQSLPLPEENKPANFSGAIGQFEIAASAGPNNVTVGDPVTVRVQISGHGALDTVKLPEQSWPNFKTFPPTAKVETTDQFGLQGTKTFEQIISPMNADVHEIPALNFSYFDPVTGKYRTLTQAAVPLTVKAAGATPLPQIAATKSSTADNQTPQDILPIKSDLGTLERDSVKPLIAKPVFLAVQSLPVLAFIGAFVWRRRADNLANNPRLRRQRAVAQIVASGMGDLKKFAAGNQPDEFFATLFRLLQEQLGERLDCPASAITENIIDEHPVLRAAPETTRTALREQFQLCNQARYAPVRGTSELNSVAAQFERLLGELRNLKT
ncbi:MAG TPA: BatD family protein [Candidatus Sulfotelmatobacter sp.]|jgi:hypothetical protein|nr:BatD family protein [Candidatus Sulfotelmatobacter sp.]